jgi:hypothetical protein
VQATPARRTTFNRKRKKPLEKSRHRLEDNIKKVLNIMVSETSEWINILYFRIETDDMPL